MKYFAGIDGGQSSTIAVVGDETGRILGRGLAGPADEIDAGPESTRLRDALRGALDDATNRAGLSIGTAFEAVVAGISGYEGHVYGKPPELPATRVTLMHDGPIAHAGALGGETGAVVIAGTGSAAYIVDDDGCSARKGGWGYLFGDEGSAFWIAREAIRSALGIENHDVPGMCATARAAAEFFGCRNLRDAIAAFYHGAIQRRRLAGFAEIVIGLSRELNDDGGWKDPCAGETVEAAESWLGRLAAGVTASRWHWKGRPRVTFVGGLMRDVPFKTEVYSQAKWWATSGDENPDPPPRYHLNVTEPRHEPAAGALLLAYREAGISVAEIRP